MSLSSADLTSLASLPCFEEAINIEPLTSGMSHTCVKVTSSPQCFFVKKLNKNTAKVEAFCANSASMISANNLTPAVIYSDEHWLVTEFIDGITLSDSSMSNPDKLSIGLNLMAKLHQLSPLDHSGSIPLLETKSSVLELLTNDASRLNESLPVLEGVALLLSQKIKEKIDQEIHTNLLCHGDINFTNILIESSHAAWLIDFECAHLAPREFDIAMFIAVNNISIDNIETIVNLYESLVPNTSLDTTLLSYYLLYSYFINGLWYLNNINEVDKETMFWSLAIEQWRTFDNCVINLAIKIPKLSSLLF